MKHFLSRILNTALLLTFLFTQLAYGVTSTPPMVVTAETPASLACVYGLTPGVAGCPLKGTTATPTTGSGAIAIIDGQDAPSAYNELTQFSSQFHLTTLPPCSSGLTPCFQQYYVSQPFDPLNPCVAATNLNNAAMFGISPSTDVEPELDIEWAHAMAPNASIYMVETQGWVCATDQATTFTSLLHGMQCAAFLLKQNYGGGVVSYSHSVPEFAGEIAFDASFQTPGIIYIASAGDYSKPANYPAASPYVIAAGGTEILRDVSGNFLAQTAWQDPNPSCTNDPCSQGCKTGGSGGPSVYEPRPSFQNNVQRVVGSQRGTPDISFAAANINVFCCQAQVTDNKCCVGGTGTSGKPCESLSTTLCPSGFGKWVATGGTSLASPALAGIINSANGGATTTTQELSKIYTGSLKNYSNNWTDIILGNNGFAALKGYDFTTGLGVPRGYGGK
ncbi:MAG: S8 family serine peptidase [Pseudomonadota bacterium]